MPGPGNRRGRGRRPARGVARDQLQSHSPLRTLNALPPDTAFLQSRVVSVANALDFLRQEVFELIKLFPATPCSKSACETNLRQTACLSDPSPSLEVVARNGHPNTRDQRGSTTQQHQDTISGLKPLETAEDLETPGVLPSTEPENSSADEQQSPSRKRPREISVDDGPLYGMITFSNRAEGLVEVPATRKTPYTREKQRKVQRMRELRACNDCRRQKRECQPEHPRPKNSSNTSQPSLDTTSETQHTTLGKEKLYETVPSNSRAALACPRSTPELPALFSGPELRRLSLPPLASEPATNQPTMSRYRQAHGVPKKLSVDRQREYGYTSPFFGIDMKTAAVPMSQQLSHVDVSSPYLSSRQPPVSNPSLQNGTNWADLQAPHWRPSDQPEPSPFTQSFPSQTYSQPSGTGSAHIPNSTLLAPDVFLSDPFHYSTETGRPSVTSNQNGVSQQADQSLESELRIDAQFYRKPDTSHENIPVPSVYGYLATLGPNLQPHLASYWSTGPSSCMPTTPSTDYTFQEPSSPFSILPPPATSRLVPSRSREPTPDIPEIDWDHPFLP